MTISERIQMLLKEHELSRYEVAQSTGISQSTMSRLFNDNTAKVQAKTLELLANYFKVNLHWLKTGKGEMNLELPEQTTEQRSILSKEEQISELILQNKTLIKVIERHSRTIENLSEKTTNSNSTHTSKKEHGLAS